MTTVPETIEANPSPNYLRVFQIFLLNSLVRDMTFRANFIIDCISSLTWVLMNIGFYLIIFSHTNQIAGWGKYEFFIFLGTGMIINSIVQAFFMPNCEEFSEMIRTGGLDFALLKPIDTQFLISLRKVEWSSLSNLIAAVVILAVGLTHLITRSPDPLVLDSWTILLYPVYVACGVVIMYSLMIALSASSIWLGRNQSLYDFWFYITNFSRYPMEIYEGTYGRPLRWLFTFIIPVLVVVNVPAQVLAQPISPLSSMRQPLAAFTIVAALLSFLASRWLFQASLFRYRSASS